MYAYFKLSADEVVKTALFALSFLKILSFINVEKNFL